LYTIIIEIELQLHINFKKDVGDIKIVFDLFGAGCKSRPAVMVNIPKSANRL